ncbi:MAG: hypothetical protein IJR99_15080 [Kiritimatiellae bacterium]|nr:hypothetical protein [Kiritimatiellia bacterium]
MKPLLMHRLRLWIGLWCILLIGHLIALFLICGANLLHEWSWPFWKRIQFLLVWLTFSSVVYAGIGPLGISALVSYLLRVEGGTPVARLLLFASVLIYAALVWMFRKWFSAKNKSARWSIGFLLMAYSALATASLLFVA